MTEDKKVIVIAHYSIDYDQYCEAKSFDADTTVADALAWAQDGKNYPHKPAWVEIVFDGGEG